MSRSHLLVCLAVCLSLPACSKRVPLVSTPVSPLRTEAIPVVDSNSPSARFGSLFCGVLPHTPAAIPWGYCDGYFAPAGTPADVDDFPAAIEDYRVLVVPGIFGQCVEALARPFEDARRHLQSAHNVEVEYLSVSAIGSSEHNARQIAEYLQRQFTPADRRPYIAFGYSKGAPDLLEAVASHAIAREAVAAVVTVAGAVLGSRLTEGVPRNLVRFLERERLGECDAGDAGGIDSLRRADRAAAMVRFRPPQGFRAYSIAAVSTGTTTSRVLANGWNTLRAYSLEQDSQVIHEDAIVPGATYLGIAKGDHWAVALPFSDVPDTHEAKHVLTRWVNRNIYPRVALFEAALRFVLAELPPR